MFGLVCSWLSFLFVWFLVCSFCCSLSQSRKFEAKFRRILKGLNFFKHGLPGLKRIWNRELISVDNSEQVACLRMKHPKRRKKRRHKHELHEFPAMGSSGL